MTGVRVILLGNPHASDDGAALRISDLPRGATVVRAGRPGARLLDLLEGPAPVVLVDVVRSVAAPGSVHEIPLDRLTPAAVVSPVMSSHGFGVAEALELARVLGRALPEGVFLGIEGVEFGPGEDLSPAVEEAVPRLGQAVREAVIRLERAHA